MANLTLDDNNGEENEEESSFPGNVQDGQGIRRRSSSRDCVINQVVGV
jgi:hypothetical protein